VDEVCGVVSKRTICLFHIMKYRLDNPLDTHQNQVRVRMSLPRGLTRRGGQTSPLSLDSGSVSMSVSSFCSHHVGLDNLD
jgi:hypothetical protein